MMAFAGSNSHQRLLLHSDSIKYNWRGSDPFSLGLIHLVVQVIRLGNETISHVLGSHISQERFRSGRNSSTPSEDSFGSGSTSTNLFLRSRQVLATDPTEETVLCELPNSSLYLISGRTACSNQRIRFLEDAISWKPRSRI